LAAAEMNKDIWDWKDLHMGPGGKTCGNRDYNLFDDLVGVTLIQSTV
jgi:hypothetical protein